MKTPSYIIYRQKFEDNCRAFIDEFSARYNGKFSLAYSVKTNDNRVLLADFLKFGQYAEVVSEKEYFLAREVGYLDSHIICNGPVKTEYMTSAVENGAIVHFDSIQEIIQFCHKYSNSLNKRNFRIGIRVNIDIGRILQAEGMTQGHTDSRFGICYEMGELEKAIQILKENGFEIKGLHVHRTTASRSLQVYKALTQAICDIVSRYSLRLEYLDLGGGFYGGQRNGRYPSIAQYAELICGQLAGNSMLTDAEMILEPGSAIFSTVADYATKVVQIRKYEGHEIWIMDGSALHVNPFLKERNYEIVVTDRRIPVIESTQIIYGATCLEGDRLTVVGKIPLIEEGQIILIKNAGAYTMAMNSQFILEKPFIYYN